MTSGIYTLTFSSGNNYIGKSVNIENRWKQHNDKLMKGTAASNMQAEFNKYGTPEGKVIFQCHADHIDLVEACFINRLKPTLNATYPTDPFLGIYDTLYDDLMGMLHMSTIEHVDSLIQLNTVHTETLGNVYSLTEEVNYLLKKRSKEELKSDVNKRINSYINCIAEREATIKLLTEANAMLSQKLALPWWKKLFS